MHYYSLKTLEQYQENTKDPWFGINVIPFFLFNLLDSLHSKY
jgi:hypothetical protein